MLVESLSILFFKLGSVFLALIFCAPCFCCIVFSFYLNNRLPVRVRPPCNQSFLQPFELLFGLGTLRYSNKRNKTSSRRTISGQFLQKGKGAVCMSDPDGRLHGDLFSFILSNTIVIVFGKYGLTGYKCAVQTHGSN